MKKLRLRFERFCFQNRTKGIPNLMLYVVLANAAVYLFSMVTNNSYLIEVLEFDRELILHGQVWRLFTYAFTYDAGNILMTAIGLLCYYSLGRAIENSWGTLKFNLFYFSGIVLMDAYAMIVGAFLPAYSAYLSLWVNISYLNMSLFLAYATMYPDAGFLLFFIIPIKAWVFALIDLATVVLNVIQLPFPFNIFPIISLANYFLFFGKGVLNVIPVTWRMNARRLFRKKKKTSSGAKTIPFPNAGSYQASVATPKAPYTHRCTVCGRTDLSDPNLEFRYCSKCNGFYCYCEEHIGNHVHIQ